jgi:hypothetical protein
MWDETKSTVASGLAQLLERLTVEEKREFARLINWEDLRRLSVETTATPGERPVGDPKIYVGTTEDGLSVELPVEHVLVFVAMLPRILSVEEVEVFIQDGKGSKECHCEAADLESWLKDHVGALHEGSVMIEFGPHTLITGGGGCLSLALEDASASTLQEIAGQVLALCGFHHEFKGDSFSAIVWEDQLEVTE